ncbi:MAG: ubiquinol-cytochrome C chaperone family protein [Hyphomicrobiaceae bacterium]
MLGWLIRRRGHRKAAGELYSRIVAHSRRRQIYADCGAPDTMDGRLEIILLMVILVLNRLKDEGEAGARLGQRLMETLVTDLDDAYRQIGIGDDGIARRVPRLAGALRERAQDYGGALEADRDGTVMPVGARVDVCVAALLEHVYRQPDAARDNPEVADGAGRLAAHVLACQSALKTLSQESVLSGQIVFPDFAVPD